jgi:hypothetical protein
VLEPVRAVADVDDVRARLPLDERADQEAARVRDVMLNRPALSYEAVERAAGGHVVDGKPEYLVADREGLGHVVAVEQEDGEGQSKDGDDAGADLEPAAQHREDDRRVQRQEGEGQGDSVERRPARGRLGRHGRFIGRPGTLPKPVPKGPSVASRPSGSGYCPRALRRRP